MFINALQHSRYSITGSGNGGAVPLFGSRTGLLTVATTYENLIATHKERLLKGKNPEEQEQVVRNNMTALTRFLHSLKKNETAPIGSELSTDFERCLNDHIASSGLGERSKVDRRNLLNAWKATFEYMHKAPESISIGRERRKASAVAAEMTLFERELKAALKAAHLAPKAAARLAGVSPSALGRWARGALPNVRSSASLERLDGVLKLPPSTLTRSLAETLALQAPVHSNSYRERIRSTAKLEYALKRRDLTPELLEEWRKLLEYKTSLRPIGLRRRSGSRWSPTEAALAGRNLTVTNMLNGAVIETADIFWSSLSMFLGFLALPRAQGCYGVPPNEVQTIAWLAVPEAVNAFLEFRTARSGGLRHRGHKTFCGHVAALTNSMYGYLSQSANLMSLLPDGYVLGRNWNAMCQETFEVASSWKAESKDISRAPAEALQFFLSQEYPLRPVFAAMKKLRQMAERARGDSVPEALARRNELLLGFLASNPLRAKNIRNLTYRSDNSGSIYKDAAGQWRIRILGKHFKNRSRVGRKVYDVQVAKWLASRVEDYVTVFRPVLVGDTPDAGWFLLSSRGGGRLTIGAHVYKLTKSLIPQCGGISSHAFRHLVATDWLTKNPNDFVTVAELLNDTVAVVLSEYAHLRTDAAFNRYEAYLAKQVPPELM
jgi:integrase/transcriptional regulator with XRE-family HTH domain